MEDSTSSCSSVCELISKLQFSSPHAIALEDGSQHLTYEELSLRADHFAAYLAELGVASGATVALCLDRSFDWIIAALGILKLGAAYVPLDNAWPDSRLQFALEDSRAAAFVAPAALLTRLAAKPHGVDPIRDAAAIAATTRLEPRTISPDALAYVIYTSGSTGVPKGVEITHANLTHLIDWHLAAFDVTATTRASHLAGLGFDAAVWELWPYLAAGATICLVEDSVRTSPQLLQQWLLDRRITHSFVPTVHAAPMLTMNWPPSTPLRYLLTGGDALHRALSTPLPFTVVNNYGPTETTVVATSCILEPGAQGVPTIGRAITGATVYLLDEARNPVPDGQTGEIYIGGTGVGRGYRNLPEATAQAFLPDPFAPSPTARMYRSGDLGARRPNGDIEFHGRRDRQAKIRGYRIELDEIGSTLAQHPAVEFAVVTVSSPETSADTKEPHLVAYILPTKKPPVASELQQHLQLTLPSYMIPAIFVKLDAIPLTPNGKLDLAALPNPATATTLPLARIAARAAATPIEERLLELMRELLESDAITPEDNFFLAGGHSLLGMQLIMRLRQTFQVSLTLRQLFESPTVEGLARVVETRLAEDRLQTIWKSVLHLDKLTLDADFFEHGGNPALLSSLQRRIIASFGRRIPLDDLRDNPTIRQQAKLIHGDLRLSLALPPGVLALNTSTAPNSFFWIHYPCENLAKAMPGDRPFLFVTLTEDDLGALGEHPLLESIATCLFHKILATQPSGPYTLGGFCVGGILAFEIARQMEATGHEVSLLVLLDTPSPIYYKSPHLLAPRLNQAQFLLKRVTELGLKESLTKLRERLSRYLPGHNASAPSAEQVAAAIADPVQDMIEAAAASYQPKPYAGHVVLLLASGHPPHVNFQPGWKALSSGGLQTQYIEGQHLELTQAPVVFHVAEAIHTHLIRATAPPLDASQNDANELTICC